MKIRMRTSLTVFADGARGEVLTAGSLADLPDALAQSLVAGEYADPVEEERAEKMLPPPENKAVTSAHRRRSREG